MPFRASFLIFLLVPLLWPPLSLADSDISLDTSLDASVNTDRATTNVEDYQDSNTYTLGEGLQLGNSPIYIGGYVSMDYQRREHENRYRLDDIALLSYGQFKSLSYMFEAEFKSFWVKYDTDYGNFISRDQKIYIERAYLDYQHDEHFQFKLGKYNSPIGYWNLLPINVLRDTTSSPELVDLVFPRFTTGLEASYTSFAENSLQFDVMLQANPSLDDDYNNYHVKNHLGLGLTYELDNLSLKINAGFFKKDLDDEVIIGDNKDFYYALMSARYEVDQYQVTAELGTQWGDKTQTTRYAGYIQGAYYFTAQHTGIIRLESYDNHLYGINDNIAIFGYTYRPVYPVAFKLEYQRHSLEYQNQWLFSLSVLF